MGSTFTDLTPLDFFAWGFINSKAYTGRGIGNLAELRNRIIDEVQKITPEMLESVFRETIYRFELCKTLMVAMWRQINSTNSSWYLL